VEIKNTAGIRLLSKSFRFRSPPQTGGEIKARREKTGPKVGRNGESRKAKREILADVCWSRGMILSEGRK